MHRQTDKHPENDSTRKMIFILQMSEVKSGMRPGRVSYVNKEAGSSFTYLTADKSSTDIKLEIEFANEASQKIFNHDYQFARNKQTHGTTHPAHKSNHTKHIVHSQETIEYSPNNEKPEFSLVVNKHGQIEEVPLYIGHYTLHDKHGLKSLFSSMDKSTPFNEKEKEIIGLVFEDVKEDSTHTNHDHTPHRPKHI